MEKVNGNRKHTGTPAANAASQKKGNTPGSQGGRRGDEKAASGDDPGRLRKCGREGEGLFGL